MTLKIKTYLFYFVIITITGCHTVTNNTVELSSTEYTITAIILELSKKGEQLYNKDSLSLKTAINRKDTKTEYLPTIHLDLGETSKIDNRESYEYPILFDINGNPVKYRKVQEGQFLHTTLTLMGDGTPKLKIYFNCSEIIGWKTIAQSGEQKTKCPVLSKTKIDTTIFPEWGKWQEIGSMTATTNNKGQIVLIRIDKPEHINSNNY